MFREKETHQGVIWVLTILAIFYSASVVNAKTDVTSKIEIIKSPLMYDRLTKTSYLDVSIKNISLDVLLTPIKVVVDGVSPSTVKVSNAEGLTADGKPFFSVLPENQYPRLQKGCGHDRTRVV